MTLNLGISSNFNDQSVAAKARFLMSNHQQRLRNRAQAMLNRSADEVGVSI